MLLTREGSGKLETSTALLNRPAQIGCRLMTFGVFWPPKSSKLGNVILETVASKPRDIISKEESSRSLWNTTIDALWDHLCSSFHIFSPNFCRASFSHLTELPSIFRSLEAVNYNRKLHRARRKTFPRQNNFQVFGTVMVCEGKFCRQCHQVWLQYIFKP